MEEKRKTGRSTLLVTIVGALALAAVWATMALASGSSQAPTPVKAKAKPAQSSSGHTGSTRKHRGEDCPFKNRAASDL